MVVKESQRGAWDIHTPSPRLWPLGEVHVTSGEASRGVATHVGQHILLPNCVCTIKGQGIGTGSPASSEEHRSPGEGHHVSKCNGERPRPPLGSLILSRNSQKVTLDPGDSSKDSILPRDHSCIILTLSLPLRS